MSFEEYLQPDSTPAKRVDPKRTATVRDIELIAEGKAERCLLLPELLTTTGCDMVWKVPYAEDPSECVMVPAIKNHVRNLLDEGKAVYVAEADIAGREFVLAVARSYSDLPRVAPYAGGDFLKGDLKQFLSSVTIKRIRAVAANRSQRKPIFSEGKEVPAPPRERAPVEPKPRVAYLTSDAGMELEDTNELDMSSLRSTAAGLDEFIPAATRVIMKQLQSASSSQYFSLHDFCLAANKLISDEGKLPLQLTKAHYRAAKTLLTGADFAVFNRKRMGSQGNLIPVFASVQAQMRFIDKLNNEAQSTEERNKLYADQRFRFEGIEGEDNSGYDGDDE